MERLVFASASDLIRAMREGSVPAVEVLEAHLAQIARHNPALNAFVTIDEEGARRRAQAADAALRRGEVWGPLHGVPVTIKDAIETAGLRTTSGYPPLAKHIPTTDAPVVARLRAAGAIILGKTNLPPLAGDSQTSNPIAGRTNNPWNLECTSGGSTGGGAVAVATGMSPLEIGSDFGGSVRTPAHYCGIYALKPTVHRVPFTGHIPPLPGASRGLGNLGVIGPLARSVDDLLLALRLIAGPDEHDWDVPPASVEAVPDPPLSRLRLAWTDDLGGVAVTPDTTAALTRLAGQLERLGCAVERRAPDRFDLTVAWETYGELVRIEFGPPTEAETEPAEAGASLSSDVPVWFRSLLRGSERGQNATLRQYAAAMARRGSLIAALEQFFDTWDALICPVAAGPAFPHCPPGTPVAYDGAYCTPFNLTGHPAVVLPLARSTEGLPIGLQLVGPRWGEMKLLTIATRLAEVIGPLQHPPGY